MKQGQEIIAKFPGILIIYQKIRGKKKGRHQHTSHEVFIPLQGEIGIRFDEKVLKAGQGKMIYIPPNLEHAFTSSESAEGERLYLFVEHELWDKLGGVTSGPKVLPVSQLSKELLFHLLTHQNSKAVKSLGETLVHTFSEMLENDLPAELDSVMARITDARIRKVWEIIEGGFSKELPMAQLARESGLSLRSLNRLFLEETGITPKQAITLQRIEMAKSLLLQNKSVTEVAYDVGYGSLSQFITTFRTLTGKLPSEYRRI